ncbi:50S ribosomal protein L3 [Planctomycetales bacterium ZRK34]|nr:50S ribosomal protein L3 [Planctomycetales bacterium ZRK34]
MAAAILGRKVGMTRYYTEEGVNVPVTIVEAGPCFVSQIKTPEADGYAAIQVAFEDVKPRRTTQPVIGHDAKAGISAKRFHKEFRIPADEVGSYELGQKISVEQFEAVKYVDVVGTSKGKGFAGTMKRHNYKGQLATHGVERKHRSPGSIGGHANNAGGPGGPKKGKKMSGQMGNVQVTVRSLDIVAVDKDKNLLLVKGPVPGANNGMLIIREAGRLYKSKANKLAG